MASESVPGTCLEFSNDSERSPGLGLFGVVEFLGFCLEKGHEEWLKL